MLSIRFKGRGNDSGGIAPATLTQCLVKREDDLIWLLRRAIRDGSDSCPSSRRSLGSSSIVVAFLFAAAALSPATQAAEDQADPSTMDPVVVTGVRPPVLDGFNNDMYGRVSPLSLASNFGTIGPGYYFIPSQQVPSGAISSVVPSDCSDAAGNPEVAGNPVVLLNGNKIEREVDFVAGGEAGLHLQRVYNHYWPGIGIFGKNWISNFDFKLAFGSTQSTDACYPRPGGGTCGVGANTKIYALRPDGSVRWHELNAADGIFYEVKDGPVSKIVRQTNGDFVLYGEGNQIETYSSSGYIKSVENAQGVGWTFAYTNLTYPVRVTHTSGRYVEFIWTGNQLTTARDPAGTSYSYTYTANQFGTGLHRLASASQANATTTYHYELAVDPSALTGKSFNGARYSTFTYGAGTRPAAIQTTHNGVETWKFTYEDMSGAPGGGAGITVTTYVNPLGRTTKNAYKNGKIYLVSGLASANCPGTIVSTTYNATTGYPEVVTDASGNKTALTYNTKGQLLAQTEAYETPLARTITYAWDDAKNRKIRETVAGLSETSFSYANHGRFASVVVRDLVTGQVRTTTYHYTHHSNGVLASARVDAPLTADDVTRTYSTSGDLITVTNAGNQVTTYGNYNALGQPGRIISPSGAVVEYDYDARGRVVAERTFPAGSPVEVRYVYGASGLLEAKSTSDGNTSLYHYDSARRLIQEDLTEPGGGYSVKRYTYDAMSNPIKVEIGRDN